MSEIKTGTDKRLFYKLNVAQRLLLKYADRKSRRALGVSITQTGALFYLMKNDGCLFKDLSEILMQNKSAITTLVERMEKNGLIIKKKSEIDGRASNIFLTDKGRDISKNALSLMADFNHGILDKFTKDEVVIIHRFLDTIMEDYKS